MHFLYDKRTDRGQKDIFSIQNEEDGAMNLTESIKIMNKMKIEITKLTYNDLTIIPDHREGVPVISDINSLLPDYLIPKGKNSQLGKMKIQLD